MQPRMKNPMMVVPDVMPALMTLARSMLHCTLPTATLHLANLRASQINGSSVCVDMHAREARKAGDTEGRLFAVAAWRQASCFSDSERAALALSESMTRMSDRTDPVPDDVWNDAAQYFDERSLATLVLSIGMVNFGNRVNATTKQMSGECECPKPNA